MSELDALENVSDDLISAAEKMMNEAPAARKRNRGESLVVTDEEGQIEVPVSSAPEVSTKPAEVDPPAPSVVDVPTDTATDTSEVTKSSASTESAETATVYREILSRLEAIQTQMLDVAKPKNPSDGKKSKGWHPFRRAEEMPDSEREDFSSLDDIGTEEPPEILQRRQDAESLLKAVEDRIFSHAMTHHSSLVVLIGWGFAMLSLGLGMSWGYIAGSGRYPSWWPKPGAGMMEYLASVFLGAPVGVLLLPLSALITWRIAQDPAWSSKGRKPLQAIAIVLGLCGIALPFISLL